MPSTPRCIEQIFEEEHPGRIYALAVFPEWDQWHPTNFPKSIAVWMSQHFPDVVIEPVVGWEGRTVDFPEGHELAIDSLTMPGPIFRIGFNAEQADRFNDYWHNETQGAWKDFLFLDIDFSLVNPPSPTDEDIRECIDYLELQPAQSV